jgi:hypothetical protein
MSINAVLIIIIIVSVFPALVSILLRGKYFKIALPLSVLNIVIAVAAFLAIIEPSNRCRATNSSDLNNIWSKCDDHSWIYFLISLLNILVAIIIWYLAFKRNEDVPLTDNTTSEPLVGSQLALQSNKEGLRKFLSASGWLITLGIIIFVVLIAVIGIAALAAL